MEGIRTTTVHGIERQSRDVNHAVRSLKTPRNGVRRFLYQSLVRPRARLFLTRRYRWQCKNARALRGMRRHGVFLYGNRTGTVLDALVPAALTDKPVLVPAPRDELSCHRPLARYCSGVETPASPRDVPAFLARLEKQTVTRGAVAVLLTASCGEAPFLYPVRFDEPSFVFYTCVSDEGALRPRAVTRVAGPFYPDTHLAYRARLHELGARLRGALRALEAEAEKEATLRV